MQFFSHFSISNFLQNIKISVDCEKSSFHFQEFSCSEPLLQINRRVRENNLVEILGSMVEKLKILGCFRMECTIRQFFPLVYDSKTPRISILRLGQSNWPNINRFLRFLHLRLYEFYAIC
jgi:hypothetical protein